MTSVCSSIIKRLLRVGAEGWHALKVMLITTSHSSWVLAV